MARKQAKAGKLVGIFSLEMSTEQLIDRIFSAETEIELQVIRKGGLHREQWSRLDATAINVMGYPMFVSDRAGITINDITSIAKQWKMKFGLDIIYIDYLQLITGSGNVKGANREQEISEISRRLKILAKDLNIPVVALSQLSRKCEERADKRPMLSDLRESGAIEQDADMVIFPFSPSYYDDSADPELCEIDIAKYRNGKTGMIEVNFNKAIQKFSNKGGFDVF
jgi:replicative DNA helicase